MKKNLKIFLILLIMINCMIFICFKYSNIVLAKDNNAKGMTYIDSPKEKETVEGTVLEIEGWAMSTDADAKVKLYIDENEIQEEIKRTEREDVLSIVKGYGSRRENPKPGLKANVNVKNLKYGEHTIKLEVVSDNNVIRAESRKVIIDNRIKGMTYIDSPKERETIEGTVLEIKGWAMSTDADAKVKLYIDGNEIQEEIKRTEREDVLSIVKGYGSRNENPKPGLKANVNVKNLKYGEHTIKLEVVSDNNVIRAESRKVIIDNRIKGIINIDTPHFSKSYIEGNSLNIDGWVLCNDANSSLHIYIDDEEINNKIMRSEREDVLAIVSGYGGRQTNPTPGCKVTIDISKYEKAKVHTIKYILKDSENNIVKTQVNSFMFYSDDIGRLYIEAPSSTKYNGSNILVEGWELSSLPDSIVKIYIDGNECSSDVERLEREDVLNAVPGYGGKNSNSKPGFKTIINTKKYLEGNHNIDVKLFSKEGKLLVEQRRTIFLMKNFGIDVSKWQGNINWNQASQHISYSIIRIGFGQTLTNKDKFFEANYNSCIQNGIPVGVYLYSYALNVEEARLEAYACLNWLNGRNIQLPVFWDVEDKCQSNIDRNTLTAMADTFCSIIQNNGYKAGIYGSKNWLTNKLDMKYLEQKYDVWVAQYYRECTYQGRYDIWQYSSEGNVSGIKGKVDCNYFYKKY